MRVAFRVDASSLIGSGHVVRCLTLAAALRDEGANCVFFCKEDVNDLTSLICRHGFEVRKLTEPSTAPPPRCSAATLYPQEEGESYPIQYDWSRDANGTVTAMRGERWDWLVVDHYDLEIDWQMRLRSCCGRIAVIDDLADRFHDCDLLVDPGADPELPARYREIVCRSARLLIGPQYAILRPEFEAARALSHVNQSPKVPKRLLVMFGGADEDGHTYEALQVISQIAPKETVVDVVVSVLNKDRRRLESYAEGDGTCNLHFATDHVASLMAKADLVIGSGGGATWERLFLRKPSFVKSIALNQEKPLQCLAGLKLLAIYRTPDHLKELLSAAFFTGIMPPADLVRNGVPAIKREMLQQLVTLERPAGFDLRRTYQWIRDPSLRKQFLVRGDLPTRSNHFHYWRKLLSDQDQRVYSIYFTHHHVGHAGIRNIKMAAQEAELWLYIGNTRLQGKGLGQSCLQMLENVIKHDLACSTAVLHVSSHNLRAFEFYTNRGYKLEPNSEPAAWRVNSSEKVLKMTKRL